MASRKLSAQRLQEIHDFAAQWGKIIARRASGEPVPNCPLDFQAMEEVAAAAAAGLTEGTLATFVEHEAQSLAPEQLCPDCGQLCPVHYEDRPLTVQGGHLTLHEPVCHCPACRRDFFPPAASPAPGQP
jgi:hypothetical protein